MNRSSIFLIGTSLFGISSLTPVYAQANPIAAGPSLTTSPASAVSNSTATAEPSPASNGDIVVTARKKEETLISVPASITAISGANLERSGTQNVTQLIGTVPSLFKTQNQSFGPAPSQTFLVIRGVGATAASDPAVGTFVDGVYQTSLAFDADFLDVENVEVLRGPQGALFGRNTEGGAISITTHVPSDVFTGKVIAEGGSFNTFKLGATASGPIVDGKLYIGATFQYDRSDGYLENVTLGEHQDDSEKYAGRVTLRATPTDRLEIILRANYDNSHLGYAGYGVPDDGSKRYITLDNEKRPSHATSYGGSATINYDLGNVKITSITGFTQIDTDYWFDFDASAQPGGFQDQVTSQSSQSEELRASGSLGSLADWLVGYYYFHETYDQARDFVFGACGDCTLPPIFNPADVALEDAHFRRHGNAGFGQIIFHPVRKLDVTVAARYSSEKVTARQVGDIALPGIGAFENFDGTNSKVFNNFSPSASVAYRWSPELTTYATVSRGFKPGGYDKYPANHLAVGLPFGSETSTNYEAGIKAELFNRLIYIQTDGFYVQIKNQQLATQVISPSGIPVGATANVGKASSRGFEFEGTVRPLHDLQFGVSTAYIATRFDEFNSAIGTLQVGDSFPFVPKWTAAVQGEYTYRLPKDQDLVFGAYYHYVGSHNNGNGSPPFDPVLYVPHYETLDFKVTWKLDRLELAAYVNNVTDRFNITSRYEPAFRTYIRDIVLPPRAFGIRAIYKM